MSACDVFTAGAGRPARSRKSSQLSASNKQSKLDVLKQENETLRAALDSVDASESFDEVESRLKVCTGRWHAN